MATATLARNLFVYEYAYPTGDKRTVSVIYTRLQHLGNLGAGFLLAFFRHSPHLEEDSGEFAALFSFAKLLKRPEARAPLSLSASCAWLPSVGIPSARSTRRSCSTPSNPTGSCFLNIFIYIYEHTYTYVVQSFVPRCTRV